MSFIYQPNYVHPKPAQTHLFDTPSCNLAKIPMKQHLRLSNDEGKLIMDNIEG